MSEKEVHDAAEARLRRADERRMRAIGRQRQAEREAQATSDQTLGQLHRDEAATHRRAAELHEQAAEAHARHAEEHG